MLNWNFRTGDSTPVSTTRYWGSSWYRRCQRCAICPRTRTSSAITSFLWANKGQNLLNSTSTCPHVGRFDADWFGLALVVIMSPAATILDNRTWHAKELQPLLGQKFPMFDADWSSQKLKIRNRENAQVLNADFSEPGNFGMYSNLFSPIGMKSPRIPSDPQKKRSGRWFIYWKLPWIPCLLLKGCFHPIWVPGGWFQSSLCIDIYIYTVC